ncbi:MAG: hypothetical protein P4L87_19580 [Formivibrio sp.]|nr:hypothetical protein [Formivibrio sp.]
MLSANQIPKFSRATAAEASRWWCQMIELGFNLNPDDDPAGCTDEAGMACFDADACAKIREIYQTMFTHLGESTYTLGQATYMNWMGYQENLSATAKNGQDFWVPALQ